MKGISYGTIRKNGSSYVVTVTEFLKCGFKVGDKVIIRLETMDELETKE